MKQNENLLATCPICGSGNAVPAINHQIGLSTDLQLTGFPLNKIQCTQCGLVRTADSRFLDTFYQERYRKAESDLVTSVLSGNTPVAFSSLVESWLKTLVPEHLAAAQAILEVGCGDGRLLHRLSAPRKVGLEPSHWLLALAKQNCGECVLLDCGIEDYASDEQFDVIVAINVFEHLLDPRSFLKKLAALLIEGGAAILVFPTQEKFNYDVCFIDHLFHMRLGHLRYLAEACGLTVVKQEVGYQSYQVANAAVLQKSVSAVRPAAPPPFIDNDNPLLMKNIFRNFIQVVLEHGHTKKIVAFGYGELCRVFEAYAEGFDRIEYFIDDYYRGDDPRIIGLEAALGRGVLEHALLVFLVNPAYREYIVEKLRVPGGPSQIYFPISGEILSLRVPE